jgi:hypothetical protein
MSSCIWSAHFPLTHIFVHCPEITAHMLLTEFKVIDDVVTQSFRLNILILSIIQVL